jgi:hypothetical protein
MTEAVDASMLPMVDAKPAGRRTPGRGLPPIEALLADGGDARLALDPITGRNKYGCPPAPDSGLADFGSSTASVISPRGFDAAVTLRERLAQACGREPAARIYARELARVRRDLLSLCRLDDLAGLEILFAASGTDVHLLAAELVGGARATPLVCVNVEGEETGSGVPAALAGRHFSTRAALGEAVAQGSPIGASGAAVLSISCRDSSGGLRDPALIEAELDAVVYEAARDRRRVLITVADVSKTGLISPGLDAVLALRRRFPGAVEVLVDACQFRLAPATLRAYLDHGLMVAVTGSKFVAGPTFSGALLIPAEPAERFKVRLLANDLSAYSARAEWPAGWAAGARLPEAANFGLLLRWEAALTELAAFRAAPEPAVCAFMTRFASAISTRLDVDPVFEALPVRPLDRSALGVSGGWDAVITIFPFRLRHLPADRACYLSLAAVDDVYRAVSAEGARLGQPVLCGEHDGRPVSALRLCNSARLAVEGARDPIAIIGRAMGVLDQVAAAARRITRSGRI